MGSYIFQLPSHKIDQTIFEGSGSNINSSSEIFGLPDNGFRAKIIAPDSLCFEAGNDITLQIKVINKSDVVWPGYAKTRVYPIQLGNHWFDENHNLLLLDDGRSPLQQDLNPLEEIEFSIKVRAPIKKGLYLLEFDMVQEGIAWFKDKGSESVTVPVQIIETQPTIPHSQYNNSKTMNPNIQDIQGEHTDILIPVIEMHGIPQDEVIALIEKQGGKVIDIQRDNSAGSDWESYRYLYFKMLK